MPSLRTFSSLKNTVYRFYYGGILCQMAAMNMQMVTRSYLTYDVTDSASILGAMALAHAVPMTVLSLFGGVMADRMPKKYTLIVGLVGSAAVAMGMALALAFDYLSAERVSSWWVLIVASVVQGIIMGLMMPSRQSIIAEIVSVDQLMNAIALNTFGMNVLRFLMPALAGVIIDTYGYETVYYIMTGLYVISVVFIGFLPLTRARSRGDVSALADLKDGLRYVRREPTILLILGFTLVIIVLSRPYQFLLPVFTVDILKAGATEMGILMSVAGIGAMLGSLVLASIPGKKRGILLIISGLMLSLALASFSFSEKWILSLTLIAFVGLGDTGRVTLANTLVQYYVDDKYRGRVMSLLMMEFGIMSFGVFFAGLMTDAIGVQWSIGGLAILLCLVCIGALAFSQRLRKLE